MKTNTILLLCIIGLSINSLLSHAEYIKLKELAESAIAVAEKYKNTTNDCIETMKKQVKNENHK